MGRDTFQIASGAALAAASAAAKSKSAARREEQQLAKEMAEREAAGSRRRRQEEQVGRAVARWEKQQLAKEMVEREAADAERRWEEEERARIEANRADPEKRTKKINKMLKQIDDIKSRQVRGMEPGTTTPTMTPTFTANGMTTIAPSTPPTMVTVSKTLMATPTTTLTILANHGRATVVNRSRQ